ncbi:MAG: HAMP domain-containing sensor histidine kinase [Gemmatimonadota bacterium]|nr:HAMP domain-containing sensor histidine kinase [Gemmatimonadota bacterium]
MDDRRGATAAEPALRPDELEDADRILRGLPPDVQPIARFLAERLGPAPPGNPEVPRPKSFEVIGAAVGAVREIVLDATDRGLPPQRARVLHGRLDREVEGLMRRVVRESRSESRELLRDVSHDLRSPLGSILFLADALAGEQAGSLNEVQRRQASVLYTAALSLEGLLNDLIDASQLGQLRAIEPVEERFSLEAVLERIDQLSGPLAAQRGVELAFRLETLGPRVGDRRILTRLLLNLVSNAIRATPRGGRVEVRAWEERATLLFVSVEDRGTGADLAEIRRHLTEAPLLGVGSRESGWTHGLGLSICSRLVEAVEGRIEVESKGEEGCRFTLTLPFPRA